MTDFVLNDETIRNSHGFYLLNGGGDFKRFDANPVMLDCHDLTKLLGRWADRKIEGSIMTATPDFDMDNASAAERAGQVERGYLKGASVGIIIHRAEMRFNASSEVDEIYVTEWELFEASIVTVPSNAGALMLKIYDPATESVISAEMVQAHVTKIVELSLNTKTNNMAKLNLTADALSALGVADSADSAEVSATIVTLKASNTKQGQQIETLQASNTELGEEVQTLKTEATEASDKVIKTMVDLAISEGRAQESQRESLTKYAKTDLEACREMLTAKEAKPSLADAIAKTNLGADRSGWNVWDWKKNDPQGLEALKISNPSEYSEILKKLK